MSVVRNEQDILEATIRNLVDQGLDRVLIADHGSTDNTREIAASFS